MTTSHWHLNPILILTMFAIDVRSSSTCQCPKNRMVQPPPQLPVSSLPVGKGGSPHPSPSPSYLASSICVRVCVCVCMACKWLSHWLVSGYRSGKNTFLFTGANFWFCIHTQERFSFNFFFFNLHIKHPIWSFQFSRANLLTVPGFFLGVFCDFFVCLSLLGYSD